MASSRAIAAVVSTAPTALLTFGQFLLILHFDMIHFLFGKARLGKMRGFTLVEITLVLGLVVGLSSLSIFGVTYFTSLAKASRAEAVLKQVENARISYLSDTPTASYTQLTPANLDPYIPGGWNFAVSVLSSNGYSLIGTDIQQPLITYGRTAKDAGPVRGFLSR